MNTQPRCLYTAVTGKPPDLPWLGGHDSFGLSEEYLALCAKVAALNFEAAKYMAFEAPKEPWWKDEDDLDSALHWSNTPQGEYFWHEMWVKVHGYR